MRTVDIDEAETNLSSLVEAAAGGNPFIITRAGRPVVTGNAARLAPSSRRNRLSSTLAVFFIGAVELVSWRW